MNEDKGAQYSADDFLSAATAGLKTDRELQLDVRAELLAHIEDHQLEAEAEGMAPEDAAQKAVDAMGSPVDVGTGLAEANRRRMKLRALVRMAAQWLLAPAAVFVALLMTNWDTISAMRAAASRGNTPELSSVAVDLTPEEQLVLLGDASKPAGVERQKAIWERWPSNKKYLHHYVTHLLSKSSEGAAVIEEIVDLQSRDPNNARFDYIVAGLILRDAVDWSGDDKGYLIKDRAKLDEAMARLKAGLALPEYP